MTSNLCSENHLSTFCGDSCTNLIFEKVLTGMNSNISIVELYVPLLDDGYGYRHVYLGCALLLLEPSSFILFCLPIKNVDMDFSPNNCDLKDELFYLFIFVLNYKYIFQNIFLIFLVLKI